MSTDSPPPLSGRPAAGTEQTWLRANLGGTGTTVLALLLSNPLPIPSLLTALHSLQLHHPLLRSSLNSSTNPPFFEVSDTPTLSLSPSPIPLPSLNSVLEHELNLNPYNNPQTTPIPLAFATTYELTEGAGKFALALRFHTAVCDRTSGVAILKELLEIMGGSVGVNVEEKELRLGVEDLIRKDDGWKPFWLRGKDLIGYSINGLRTSTLGFEDAVSERRSEVVRLVMSREETEAVLSEIEKREIKLCNVMAAACVIAAHSSKKFEQDQGEVYSVVTLIDCRNYLDPVLDDDDMGFYHSAILNTHYISGGESLWEVALRCHNSYSYAMSNKKHLKDIGDLNYLMCKAIENPHLTPSSSLRTALVSVFDDMKVYNSSDLLHELGVEDYIGCASLHGIGPSIAIFDTIRDGRLDGACVYPAPLHSREQITELVEHMKRIIIEESIKGVFTTETTQEL